MKYRRSGRITPENNINVAIADTGYDSPLRASKSVSNKLGDMFGSNVAQQGQFDLFYSPVGSRLRGMRNYNPAILTKSYAFAGLLADAIERSKNQERVVWASEGAGSVVLTQGLIALSGKNLSFTEQGHIVKMCWATTDPGPTYAAARQLGMLADKNLLKGNGNIRASISALLINASRARNKEDHYSWNDYGKDMGNGAITANNVVGISALAGAAATGSPVLTTVGTVTGTIGAMQFAYSVIKNRIKRG